MVDVAYGGAMYASLPAASAGLAVLPERHDALVAVGREIKRALNVTQWTEHPVDPRLSGIYGVIWHDDLGTTTDGGPHQRNVMVFADGEVDRSPCGSGTSARLALLLEEGAIAVGQTMVHDSIIGSRFEGRVLGTTACAVATEVEGVAFKTAESTFVLDPRDPLGTGVPPAVAVHLDPDPGIALQSYSHTSGLTPVSRSRSLRTRRKDEGGALGDRGGREQHHGPRAPSHRASISRP